MMENRGVVKKLASFVLLLGLSGFGAVPASAQQVEYYHLDALGSVRAITDGNRQIVTRHDYEPYGREWNAPASSDTRRFTGKERDLESGLDYFGARYYSAPIARFTTVDPVYTWSENLKDPERWNRYSYVRNNPLRYTDPDGRVIDTVADIGFIAYDLFDIGRSLSRGESVTGSQLGALGADVLGAVVPFATGGGIAVRAATKADDIIDSGRAANNIVEATRRGRQSEARVLDALGETKNTKKVRGCEGCSIPDYQNATTIGEVKDAARVSDTKQLRIQREAARLSGREHVIHTGTKTHVSGNVEARGTRVRTRDDLGPK